MSRLVLVMIAKKINRREPAVFEIRARVGIRKPSFLLPHLDSIEDDDDVDTMLRDEKALPQPLKSMTLVALR